MCMYHVHVSLGPNLGRRPKYHSRTGRRLRWQGLAVDPDAVRRVMLHLRGHDDHEKCPIPTPVFFLSLSCYCICICQEIQLLRRRMSRETLARQEYIHRRIHIALPLEEPAREKKPGSSEAPFYSHFLETNSIQQQLVMGSWNLRRVFIDRLSQTPPGFSRVKCDHLDQESSLLPQRESSFLGLNTLKLSFLALFYALFTSALTCFAIWRFGFDCNAASRAQDDRLLKTPIPDCRMLHKTAINCKARLTINA